MRGGGRSNAVNSVFYASTYHPIQAGSIDGTDILPHDNAVYRAHLCSSIGLYDPFGDPNVTGDPYCTLFVGRLSHSTTEHTLHKAMSRYGRVKNLRLVRHIVTGASRGYAFVEFETEREMRHAYKDAHHSFIDDCEIIVDYNRQQLMPGWIPRRLGGGLGGKKESGQLRFGGRERPFRAPLRPIPYDELMKLGIPPPPEGRYMSRFQVPSPPRREKTSLDREEEAYRSSKDREERTRRRDSVDRLESSYNRGHTEKDADFDRWISKDEHYRGRRKYDDGFFEVEVHDGRVSPMDKRDVTHRKISIDEEEDRVSKKRRSSKDREDHSRRHSDDREDRRRRHSKDGEGRSHKRDSGSRDERDSTHYKHRSKPQRHEEKRFISNDHSVDY